MEIKVFMRKEKSIGINAVLNGLKTVLSVIFPLITYPYAARVLQVENIGKVDFANSIVNYFVLLAGLGISTYAIREGSRVRDSDEKLEKFTSEIFSINAVSTLVSMVTLVVVVIGVPKFHSYVLIIAVQSLAIVGNLIGVTWLYSIVEDYGYITVRSLVTHIVALVLMFLFVHDEGDYVFYAATTVVANAGANIFNFYHAKKYVKIKFTRELNLNQHFKPLMIIFASTVTTTIYVNSDTTLLGFLSGDYYVGLYSTAVKVYTVLKSCIAAIILVSLPRLSNYIATDKRDNYRITANKIFRMFVVIMLPAIVGVFMVSDQIILVVGGESYTAATTSLRILSISLIFALLATYFTNAVLLPEKQETVVLKGAVMSALVNIGLNFLLLPIFNQNGAAFTTVLAELVMCVYQYLYVRQYLKIKVSAQYTGSIILGCIFIVAVCIVIDKLILGFVINLILKIAISVLIYVGTLILFKNEAAMELLNSSFLHKRRK